MNCAPLDPWDPRHLASFDPPIKHLSFHCYLRRLTSGVDRGKFLNLEDLRCKIRENCLDHPPWPAGICTKCQPSAVTLSRQVCIMECFSTNSFHIANSIPCISPQPYRHVDNVMFDHPGIVDRFLDGWRLSGRQRAGLLLGQYTEYEDVPLGIRAVVSAVYEPPQVEKCLHGTPVQSATMPYICTIGEYTSQHRASGGPSPAGHAGTSHSSWTAAGEESCWLPL